MRQVLTNEQRNSKRIVGLDFGFRRIGVAISDATQTLASPLTVLRPLDQTHGLRLVVAEIENLIEQDDGVDGIVLGLPMFLDGAPNEMTRHVQAFAELLRARLHLPVFFQDERLSSHEADSRLASHEKNWRVRKERLDSAAAAVILQDYLDGLAS